MTDSGSITICIDKLKSGEDDAAQELFSRYFNRIVGLARRKLDGTPRRMADEEDVAVSAFASFCRGAERGRFPILHDREDLWRLLAVIAARKAIDQVNHQHRQKRGGGQVRGESILVEFNAEGGQFGMADLAIAESQPEFIDAMASECQHLLAKLDDDDLKKIALLKMEGFTNEEIAEKISCARRTVQRRLKLIQEIWADDSPE